MVFMDVMNFLVYLIVYKWRVVNLMMFLVLLIDNFYGKLNCLIMFYGNRLLVVSIKYVNVIISEYLIKF